MHQVIGNNITDSFYSALKLIKTEGELEKHEDGQVYDLTPLSIHVKNPTQRCIVIPNRHNNIVQQIAESLWVLSGRDDIAFLSKYLKRAVSFSDDGKTWRGAYGKRIRDWYGVDQLKQVVQILKKKPNTGRAVINLYDPCKDINIDVIDVPCNNWMHFLIKDNKKLTLNVVFRGNDIIWGYSGINFFECTLLQELVAYWLGLEVGEYNHFAGFLCLFERHFNRSELILDHRIKSDIYKIYPNIPHTFIDINENEFEEQMEIFFSIEQLFSQVSKSSEILYKINQLCNGNFLKQALKIMYCYHLLQHNRNDDFHMIYRDISEDYYKIAASEFFMRCNPELSGLKYNIFWE